MKSKELAPILVDILDIYNKSRESGIQVFLDHVLLFQKKYASIAQFSGGAMESHYYAFKDFMDLFYNCIINDVNMFIVGKKINIFDIKYNFQFTMNSNFSLRTDNTFFYFEKYNDQNLKNIGKISRNNTLKDHSDKVVHDLQEEFYNNLVTLGNPGVYFEDDRNIYFVKYLDFIGSITFLDFIRLIFTYYHLHYKSFEKIRICKFKECKKIFYTMRAGEKRGFFCNNLCFVNYKRLDGNQIESCQNKIRQFYKRKIEELNDAGENIDLKVIKKIRKDYCLECGFYKEPSYSKKGNCPQMLSRSGVKKILERYTHYKEELKSRKILPGQLPQDRRYK